MVKRARTFPVSFLLFSFPSISLIQPQINCRYSEVSYYVSKIKIRQVFSAIFYLLLSAPEREKERERIQNVGKEPGEARKLRNYWEFRGLWVCQDAVCWGESDWACQGGCWPSSSFLMCSDSMTMYRAKEKKVQTWI